MDVTRIPLKHTGRFNRLILDYVSKDEKLNDYYSLSHELNNYKRQIEKRAHFPVKRELLADSLLSQYQPIGGAKDSVLSSIESLRNQNTFTVTTGHQLNIFTGPLYFVYKILHTIKLAEELRTAYPENQFVPIYWMNSEDHDIEEVGQFNLFGKKYVWETEQTGATGRMSPESLNDFCNQLKEVFSGNEETLEMVEIFKTAYAKFDNLATATRYFSNALFGKRGLVIIDSDDAELKQSFEAYFKKDILESKPFELVRKSNIELDSAGYHSQVNPREINTFYLSEGIRNRIVRTETEFQVLHTEIRFTEAELISELGSNPERFSPNVVLRPLFQEYILPNLTYVGGGGELSYWLQYKNYFAEMNVSFPMLALRNHFLLMDSAVGKRMDEMKLLPEDLFHTVDELIKEHLLEITDADVSIEAELKVLGQFYAQLKEKAEGIDASLVSSLEAEHRKAVKGVEQWKGKFSRSLKKKNEVSVNRIEKLHKTLFPNGYLQERHDNFLAFYSKTGSQFFDSVYEGTDPFSTSFRAIRLD
ncbi:MAG: bacillithiol biosynthesis cysteine-adding enzyme BshC [Bacteroidia bacterium]|jgi:bacillithiol biosynthesis cysteine-adding enzyme BshC